jgi:purine-binding chemotaxis protein CheW
MTDEESKQGSESEKAPAKKSSGRAKARRASEQGTAKEHSSRSKSSAKKGAAADRPQASDARASDPLESSQPATEFHDPFLGGAAALFEYAEQLEASGAEDGEQRREVREPWVCFDIADRRYALPVQVVQEVLRVDSITRVPHAPRGIRGVTNMRGRVLPVVDLRLRLGFAEQPITGASRILVALAAAGPVGLLVDAVEQMMAIAVSDHREPPPEMRREEESAALAVVDPGDQPLLLLDLERLLEPIAAASLARSGAPGTGAATSRADSSKDGPSATDSVAGKSSGEAPSAGA